MCLIFSGDESKKESSMKMPIIFDQKQNIDLKVARIIWELFMSHRYKVYAWGFFIILIQILNKTPYLNLLILPSNIIIYTFVIIMALGKFDGERIIKISIVTFLVQLALLLVHRDEIAMQVANGTYGSLVCGCLLLLYNYKKYI